MTVNIVNIIKTVQLSFLPYNEHKEFVFCLRSAIYTQTTVVGPKVLVYFTSRNLALDSVPQKASKKGNMVSMSYLKHDLIK